MLRQHHRPKRGHDRQWHGRQLLHAAALRLRRAERHHDHGRRAPTSQSAKGWRRSSRARSCPTRPEFTVSLGAQYVYELPLDWRATIRADGYWQAHSYSRIYNTSADFLESWYNLNSTLTFDNAPLKLNVQFYVKNAFNAQPLTDTYVTDPTSGLFTNTFTLDPRTYGVSVTKRF